MLEFLAAVMGFRPQFGRDCPSCGTAWIRDRVSLYTFVLLVSLMSINCDIMALLKLLEYLFPITCSLAVWIFDNCNFVCIRQLAYFTGPTGTLKLFPWTHVFAAATEVKLNLSQQHDQYLKPDFVVRFVKSLCNLSCNRIQTQDYRTSYFCSGWPLECNIRQCDWDDYMRVCTSE